MLVRNLAGMVACLLLGACSATGQNAPTEPTGEQASRAVASKHRVVILTDMEADPDDTQSLIRLLLYSNEIDIEALVATTSIWKKKDIRPDSIRTTLGKYGEVYDTLSQHAPDYPTESELQDLVMSGQPGYGMASVGTGQSTEGSDAIIRLLEAEDDRPLWISVWGGANTLAQALHDVRETKSDAEAARLISKLRVYTISDQDDSGIWMRREFPSLFYIVSPGEYGRSTWTAITRGFPGFEDHISNQWIAENIQQDHGPLGARYPDVVWGMEGDTPAYLSLIPNGLNVRTVRTGAAGVVGTNSIRRVRMRSVSVPESLVRAVCRWTRNRARSGRMRPTPTRLGWRRRMVGRLALQRKPITTIMSRCCGGEATSSVTLLRAWTGPFHPMKTRTIRRS